jgi:hypothetical protein
MDQFEPIAPCPPDGGFSLPHQAASLIFIISNYQRSSAVSSEMIRLRGTSWCPELSWRWGAPAPFQSNTGEILPRNWINPGVRGIAECS